MNWLVWKFKRLRAMKFDEVWHRMRIKLRDTFFIPKYLKCKPQEAFKNFFNGASIENIKNSLLSHLVCIPDDFNEFSDTLIEAHRIMDGKWMLFEREVTLDNPPKWNKNYLTNQEWHNISSKNIDYRSSFAGDVKFTWELGRFTFAPSLALLFAQTKNENVGALLIDWMYDFAEKNPIYHGIHQTSGIEMAIRNMTWSFALAILLKCDEEMKFQFWDEKKLRSILGLMVQQSMYCKDHLSVGSSANNHLIAEYASMVFTGGIFNNLKNSEGVFLEGISGIEREIILQLNPDGTSVEHAFGYIPFILEMIFYPLIIAEKKGHAISQKIKQRLTAVVRFLKIARYEDGDLPRIGDNDNAKVICSSKYFYRTDFIGNAIATWLNIPCISKLDKQCSLLLFNKFILEEEQVLGASTFENGGYIFYRSQDAHLSFDIGELGWGSIAAHAHADCLSITLRYKNKMIVCDPDTYIFHGDLDARNRFRSTPYHSTVNFNGNNQSEMLGAFLWGKRHKISKVNDWYECHWFSGEVHRRKLEINPKEIIIYDEVQGHNPEIVFVLHPNAIPLITENKVELTVENVNVEFTSEGLLDWRLEPGEYSEVFGSKVPTTRLCASFLSNKCQSKVVIRLL